MIKYFSTICLCLSLFACKSENNSEGTAVNDNDLAQQEETLSKAKEEARAIADASGETSWEEVEEVHFTFNVDRDTSHMARSWIWKPKTEEITMILDQDTTQYNRKNIDSTVTNADKGFINDSYWLLPQMHLVWDKTADLKVQDTATAPISGELMKKITITYPQEGGYTPGDAYDFFYDEDYKIQEWIFRRGNATEPSMLTIWEDYETFNGIDIATTHESKDRTTKLYFTDVEVITE